MYIKIKIMYYKCKTKVYLALAKPFGWVNTMFHNKHKKALHMAQQYADELRFNE